MGLATKYAFVSYDRTIQKTRFYFGDAAIQAALDELEKDLENPFSKQFRRIILDFFNFSEQFIRKHFDQIQAPAKSNPHWDVS